jgi:hypothetical protein
MSASSAGTVAPGGVQVPLCTSSPPPASGCHRVAASQSSSAHMVGSSWRKATSAFRASVSAAVTRSVAAR